MNYKEILTSCPPGGSGVHSWMMAVANIGAKQGIPQHQIEEDIATNMARPPKPASEVTDTVAKAFREAGQRYERPPVKTAAEKAEAKARTDKIMAKSFIRIAGEPVTSQELVRISPVDVTTIRGYHQQDAAKFLLNLYDRQELVWCGDTYTKEEGIATVEEWAERFLCLEEPPPFFIPNPVTGEEGRTKNETPSYRCDSTIADWRYALFEVDLPDVSLGHQAAFWKRIIESGDMPVQSVTYSGGKSLHALIRVDCRSEMEWDKKVRNGAFMEWMKIGADKTCRNPSRLSRLPGHMRNGETMQKLLWLRGGK